MLLAKTDLRRRRQLAGLEAGEQARGERRAARRRQARERRAAEVLHGRVPRVEHLAAKKPGARTRESA